MKMSSKTSIPQVRFQLFKPFGQLVGRLAKKLDDIKSMFGAAWEEPRRMEVLASLCYLARMFRRNDVEFLSDKLVSLKSHFTRDEAAEAFDWLADKRLING